MIKIGEFAILSQISIYMLRDYDKKGLLVPSYVDEESGYRYYSEEQLITANRIQLLKAMGISLKEIKEILQNKNNTLADLLNKEKDKRNLEIKKINRQISLINNALEYVREEDSIQLDIVAKEIEKRKVVSFRGTINEYIEEGLLWNKLYKECAEKNIKFAEPSFMTAIYYNNELKADTMDVEVQRNVKEEFKDTEFLKFKILDKTLVASIMFKGNYNKLFRINKAVANWIYKNNYKINGVPFNIYHISPEKESDMEKLITEVCFPICEKN